MSSDMETLMVSIVKEEDNDIEIKQEPVDECVEMESVIKQEPVDDYEQTGSEDRTGDLGHFLQVECKAGPEEIQEAMEEEPQPRTTKGCSCSKEMERLESRVNRLECLLELLVSKVKSPPKIVSASVSTQSDPKENKQLPATNNGK